MKTLAVTIGDPGGVGPEVIVKAFRQVPVSPNFRYVVAGIPAVFSDLKKKLRLSLRRKDIEFRDVSGSFYSGIVGAGPGPAPAQKLQYTAAELSRINAAIAFASLEEATRMVLSGEAQGMVNAPLNKEALRLLDPAFKGHTEYLAHAAKAPEYAMFFIGDRLKIALVTLHVPISRVSSLLTADLIFSKIRLTDEFLRKFYRIKHPKIAVCALNPHGRETGSEEDAVITPAIDQAKAKGMNASGPYPADALFYHARRREFDAVISMYHDQGLAPFKMVAFHSGVNVTIGLPFVRTSPDHGTAFDIAWKGKADPSSMVQCIRLAKQFVSRAAAN